MAIKAGKLLSRRLFGGSMEVMNYDLVSLLCHFSPLLNSFDVVNGMYKML